jgi:hypothetical protein
MTTATTDFTQTDAYFAELELSPVDAVFLESLQIRLTKLGLTAKITESGTVEAELKQCGQAYILGIFVSAKEVFYRDAFVDDEVQRGRALYTVLERKFDRKQSHWMENVKTPLEKHIFVVREEGGVRDKQFEQVMLAIELNMNHAAKTVCWAGELKHETRSAFSPVAHRAHEQPDLGVGRASLSDYETPLPLAAKVTLPFKPQDHAALVAQVAKRGNRVAIMDVTAKLFRRIMGMDYRLVKGDRWPEVARGDNDWSMPAGVGMLSTGEEVALTFCLYLALAHDAVTEGMCLGIRESLNRIDMNRQYKAFGLLRDFIAATGASVCFQTDKSDLQRLAERRMKVGANIASQALQYQ